MLLTGNLSEKAGPGARVWLRFVVLHFMNADIALGNASFKSDLIGN